MSIVWLILKIIGIVLLSLIGLILLLAAIILFVPIRYRLDLNAESKDDYSGLVKVTWLLHAISVRVTLKAPVETDVGVRVFGFRVGKKKKDKSDEEQENEQNDSGTGNNSNGKTDGEAVNEANGTESDDMKPAEETGEFSDGTAGETGETPAKPDEESDGREDGSDGNETDEDSVEQAENTGDSDSSDDASGKPKKKLSETLKGLKDTAGCMLELFSRKKNLAIDYFKKETTSYALKKVWKALKSILRSIAPRKGDLQLEFGIGDSEKTALIFVLIANLYPWYTPYITLIPNVEEQELVIRGNGFIKGKIRLFGIVVRALRICFDKKIRKVWKEATHVKDVMMATPSEAKDILHKVA